MQNGRVLLLLLLCGAFHFASAQPLDCDSVIRKVHADISAGRLREAESTLEAASAGPSCEWMILHDKAVVMSYSGRLDEAERYAARALAILDKTRAPEDPAFLRPLQMLSSLQTQQGKIAAARNTLDRMRKIPLDRPLDRALFHGASAAVHVLEKRLIEAEAEYKVAIAAWDEAIPSSTADVAALLNGLADIYINTKRYEEAGRTLSRALAIYAEARDAGPVDHIRALNSQGVLFVSQGQWQKAEDHLRAAVAIAERNPGMNPILLEPLFANYAVALRANRHGKEARSVEVRAAALRTTRQIVDITELRLR